MKMKFMEEADMFRPSLLILTILFGLLAFFGPTDGSLGMISQLMFGIFASLLVLYFVLKFIQKRKKVK